MTITLNDNQAYEVFLVLDTAARQCRGENQTINHLRELLLPVYRDWHQANPFKVHPPLNLTRNRGT
jgi:hypothetical protein